MRKRVIGMLGVLILFAATSVAVQAQEVTSDLATIRRATARYHRFDQAEADGFTPVFDCISHPTDGAMGIHYLNIDRADDTLVLAEPEVLIYEPQANGDMKLVGVEYIIFAASWTGQEAPQFLGQTLQYKTTVGPHPADPYYELHTWVWRHNPSGVFADWNPAVTCANDG